METFVYRTKRRMRCGFTTGTCAALAAKAAVKALTGSMFPEQEEITTPDRSVVRARIEEARTGQDKDGRMWAECAVRKDAGDDPDVTDGLLIFVRAEFLREEEMPGGMQRGQADAETPERVPYCLIEGGTGVGRVTKPGLDQPPGEAAINSGPRRMMTGAVLGVLKERSEMRSVRLLVSVPDGEAVAEKTFNPLLGIKGGISILGTSGIVRPMSHEALTETIRAHLKVLAAGGHRYVLAVPGNMGVDFVRGYLETADLSGRTGNTDATVSGSFVICSNFIGETIDLAGELDFSGLLFAGELGKLVKLGNGIMNTHSREGDARMETLLSCALTAGADRQLLLKIQSANTTREAVRLLKKDGILEKTMEILLQRMDFFLKRRASDTLAVEALLFNPEFGFLGGTPGAKGLLAALCGEAGSGQ